MRLYFLMIFIVFSYLEITGQEFLVLDEELNPVSNVSAYNESKTKSVLSNHEGIINLSRFLDSETIFFQHPGYQVELLKKETIVDFIRLKTNYTLLSDIVVLDKKNENNVQNVAEKKIYINRRELTEISAQTSAELLEKKGGLSVQRSQVGGGSPNIRGFEANKVLLMIDGVRLNNAIYRAGHLQNIITVDEFMLEDVEVVFGPSSVLYGSDALGGTVHMKTKDIYFRSQPRWHGSIFSSYNSAYEGSKNNILISFESKKFSTVSSVSIKEFGDLRMGSWRPHGHDNWGLVHNYVNEDGLVICNPDPGVQRGTGYKQYDFFNKIIFKTGEKSRITSNIQYSTSSNIPRFDKLNDGDDICIQDDLGSCSSGNNLKFHSYYYGPQRRFFSSLKYTLLDAYFDKSDIILGYQKVYESRHKWYLEDFITYSPGGDNGPKHNYEEVDVYSLNSNFRKGDFFLGSETVYNRVLSTTDNLENNALATRYPDNGSGIFSTAFYVNIFKRLSHRIQFEGGLRYTYSYLFGNYRPEENYVGGTDIRDFWSALGEANSLSNHILSGNIKFVYYPNEVWKISSVTSRGFHAPNVDDMYKVFVKGDNITVPYKSLKPEYALSQEISVSKKISDQISIHAIGFVTRIQDAIIKDTLFYDANPDPDYEYLLCNMMYDGDIFTSFANQNSLSPVYISGLTVGLNANVSGFLINQDINITQASDKDGSRGPYAHIPPLFGKTEFVKTIDRWKVRFLCLYAGAKKAEDYDYAGVDNIDETPLVELDEDGNEIWAGNPAWFTLNLSIKYQVADNLSLQIGVDNMLDAHYKTFGSGISAAGRSLVYAAKFGF